MCRACSLGPSHACAMRWSNPTDPAHPTPRRTPPSADPTGIVPDANQVSGPEIMQNVRDYPEEAGVRSEVGGAARVLFREVGEAAAVQDRDQGDDPDGEQGGCHPLGALSAEAPGHTE